jgi:hypothetical protein
MPQTAAIVAGQVAADNSLNIKINGVSIPNQSAAGFNQFTPFQIRDYARFPGLRWRAIHAPPKR